VNRASVGLAASVLAAMCLVGCARAPSEPGLFTSARDGFSIRYPADWEKQENVGGCAVDGLSPAEGAEDPFREHVAVVVEAVPPAMALATYLDLYLANLHKILPESEAMEVGDATLAGQDAKTIACTLAIGKVRVRCLVHVLVHKGRGYMVMCYALPETFDRHKDRFAEIAGTFRLK
jgi:hypothetical protein